VLRLFLICIALLPAMAFAAGVKEPLYGQVMFGSLKLNDQTVSFESNDEVFEGELPSSIPYLGAAAQVIIHDGVFGYGWEGGGFFSWKNHSVSYYGTSGGSGTQVRVVVDNAFWSFETFFGLYGSFQPTDRLRMYVGAGPLFLFATTKVDNVEEPEPAPAPSNTVVIDTNSYNSDFALGGYARAGLDFRIQDNMWMGVSVRHMEASLDLDKTIGSFDIDGDLYFLTFTQKY